MKLKTPSAPGRATQIDGLRAFSMLGVACVHFIPKEAKHHVPYELGLFFFLVLTGYLITGILLRDRDRGEATARPWRAAALKNFHLRRGFRILAPYYVAVAIAWWFGAQDVREALPWYLLHLSNIHLALHGWVWYTSHFWSLAAQQQFYLLWPLLIWWTPKRWLVPAMLFAAALAPAYRLIDNQFAGQLAVPDLIPLTTLDYFGLGGLFALAVHRGMPLDHPALKLGAWIACAAYAILYAFGETGHPVPFIHIFQQTLLAIAMIGLIAAASLGFTGWRGALLDNRVVQYVGKLSYSLYIYHNIAPLICGCVFPFLWKAPFDGGAALLPRLAAVGLLIWLFSWLSWKFIELPADRLKSRLTSRS